MDVAFSVKFPQLAAALDTISPNDFPNTCVQAGSSMMTTKDNKQFIGWWNDAFSRLVGTTRYHTICQKVSNVQEHGKSITIYVFIGHKNK